MADDKTTAIARVYAASLLDLAERGGVASEVGDQLAALAGMVADDPPFATFVASPTIDAGDRRESLERTLRGRADDLVVNTLQVMNAKGRLVLLPQVAAVYERLYNERHGRVEVAVTSAVPLGDDQRRRLVETLARYTGKTPVLAETVDPAVLGGLALRIGDRKIDDSVRRDIEELQDALDQRAAAEVLRGRLSRAVLDAPAA